MEAYLVVGYEAARVNIVFRLHVHLKLALRAEVGNGEIVRIASVIDWVQDTTKRPVNY